MQIHDIRLLTTDEQDAAMPSTDLCGHGGLKRSTVDQLVNASAGWYDQDTAESLCYASAWAYADLDTFARQVYCGGDLKATEFVAVSNSNQLSVQTTAYLVQSKDRRLAVLVFRGTEITNVTDWLADVNTPADLFISEGMVHGGFIRDAMLLFDPLVALLLSAVRGDSICEASIKLRAGFWSCAERPPRALAGPGRRARPAAEALQALYITGHSLGGAVAALFTALLHEEPSINALRDKLRGVYTFGQPMVGDADFARYAQRRFGDRLFRHVYDKDIVPRLPPRTVGRFEHFGQEYGSMEQGWVHRAKPVSQVCTLTGGAIVGITEWLAQRLGGIPFVERLPFPYSLADHDPGNYVRTSRVSPRDLEYTWG